MRKAKLSSATRICGWPRAAVIQVLLQHDDILILNDEQITARKLAGELSVTKGGVKKYTLKYSNFVLVGSHEA